MCSAKIRSSLLLAIILLSEDSWCFAFCLYGVQVTMLKVFSPLKIDSLYWLVQKSRPVSVLSWFFRALCSWRKMISSSLAVNNLVKSVEAISVLKFSVIFVVINWVLTVASNCSLPSLLTVKPNSINSWLSPIVKFASLYRAGLFQRL